MNSKHILTTALFSAMLMASSSLFAQVKVGTNPTTIEPASNLEVEASTTGRKIKVDKTTGQVTIADGTQGAGKVLTSDANGGASWQTQSVGCASFEAYATSQTVPINNANTDPYTKIIANVEVYDPVNAYNPATGAYTVPLSGFYTLKITGGDQLPVTNASRNTVISINSVQKGILAVTSTARTLYNDGTYNTSSSLNYLTAGDVITFMESTVHNAGGPKPASTIPFTGITFSGTRIDCNKN